MKILFDHQVFSSNLYGGVSRYFYELMIRLGNFDDVDLRCPLLFSNNRYFESADFKKYKNILQYFQVRGGTRMMYFINKIYAKINFLTEDFDVFHPTYFDPYFQNYIGNKPFVLTIFDMTHEIYPEFFLRGDKTSEHKRILSQKADKIIAISNNTKKDIVNIWGINESKVEVIHLGNSLKPNKINFDCMPDIPKNFMLCSFL